MNRLSLEARTLMYWKVSKAYRHPKEPPLQTGIAITAASDVEDQTPSTLKLRHHATQLLDEMIEGRQCVCKPETVVKPTGHLYGRSADYIIIDELGDWDPPPAA